MICSHNCMFCESPKQFFINYSKYHGVCINHSQTYERLYKCTHCNSIVPILPQACTKCLKSNIFTVTSSEVPICLACSSAPPPLQCEQCFIFEEVYKAPRCDHLVCYHCFNQNFERCPICENLYCEGCHDKTNGIVLECGHLICNRCVYNNENRCLLCPVQIVEEINKEACDKCFNLFEQLYELPTKQRVCEDCFKNSEIEEKRKEIELKNKEIIVNHGKSDGNELREEPVVFKVEDFGLKQGQKYKPSESSEVIGRISERKSVKERKISDPELKHKTPQWVNAEVNISSIEITEINPLISQRDNIQEKDCTFWTITFLLIIFYLSTLCFCFSCFCNCFQGFNSKKKTSKNLYLFCICKSKSLTRKLWTSIVKWKNFSDNKDI